MKYFDKTGKPITREKLLELFSDQEYRHVASKKIDGWFVSTVWLGIDDWGKHKKPLIFETMVFPPDSDFQDDWVERTHTLDDALAAHQRGIEYVERKLAGTQ